MAETHADNAISALSRLIVADDVEIELLSDWCAYEVIGEGFAASNESLKFPHPVTGASDSAWQVEKHSNFYRIPLSHLGNTHSLLLFEQAPDTQNWQWIENGEWKKLRIQFGFPEWGSDYNEESFLLEFPTQEFISYHKGCYLGQEVVARGTYRGHVNRAFSLFSSAESIKEDFIYTLSDLERPVGKITTAAESKGQGLIRLSALELGKSFIQKRTPQEHIVLEFEKAWIAYEK
jgi:folate-binding protein YgfZ